MTSLSDVFEMFLSLITDDLYSIFDAQDTEDDLILLLKQIVPKFEFPREPISIENGVFNRELIQEEINILANLMMEQWLRRKIMDQRNVRLEYGDKDFALRSQQAHLKVLNETMREIKEETHYMQRMYNRRTADGRPNYIGLMG
jgi:predicted rRNA methylase YqxC with S4 and FtsJ domains